MNQFEPNNLDVQASAPTKKTFVQTVIEIFSTALKRTFVKVGIAVVLALIVILIYTATQDSVQDELLDYINKDMASISELDTEVRDLYTSAREDSADDYEMYDMLRENVIPKSQELISKAEAMKFESDEIRQVHELYLESINQQSRAFTLLLSAIEGQDYTLVTQANERLDASRKAMRDYEAALDRLAEEHDVKITDK